jgi:translation initiation factor 2D
VITGVLITHVVGDHLWEMGPKTLRPEFGPPADLSVDSSENPEEDDEEGKEGSSESEQEVEDDELARNVEKMDVGGGDADADAKSSDADRTTSPEREEEQQQQHQTKDGASADDEDLLMHCLLKALKTTAKKAELPLLTSNFYRLHVLPACPDGRQVDVRKSRYKKLSVFLKEAAALYPGLLKIEETAKGVESIVAVDYGHDALRSFTVGVNHLDEHRSRELARLSCRRYFHFFVIKEKETNLQRFEG